MKIQEAQSGIDMGGVERSPGGDWYEEKTSLDGSVLNEDSCSQDSPPEMDQLSLLPRGSLIQQLLEEGSEPLPSPRSQAFRHGHWFEDDTEVPPSPPHTHSFIRRQRSLSLGASVDDQQKLTAAQVTKKIQSLRRKIRKYEEKFEEQHKYRPSHSDKAANPDVLRWLHELSRLQKELKDCRMKLSEDDQVVGARQRSYTLPRNFGSQMEREVQPPARKCDALLDQMREEDMKDTGSESETMKPLSDRYRLVKQLLGQPSVIPVIEEDDEEMEDGFPVTVKPQISMLGLLDHLNEEDDCFILSLDEMTPSKDSSSVELSNLHLATMPELLEQLKEARAKKRRIRQKLREFEDAFFRKNRRNVQKDDRSALAKEYSEYKNIKAKLRLIEVLISKRDLEDL